jgi:hypothetical protein
LRQSGAYYSDAKCGRKVARQTATWSPAPPTASPTPGSATAAAGHAGWSAT